MRKWLVVTAIVLILAAAVAFAGANLNSYLNRNKDWLEARLEGALGRPVSFDEIGISIFGGFGVRVVNLRVADDPRFSRDAFVRADRVQAGVKIIPAIFGRYEVTQLIVEKPVVVIIRTAGGFNFDTIGGAPASIAQESSHAPRDEAATDAPERGRAGVMQAIPLLISAMRVRSGEVRLIDRTGAAPVEESRELSIGRLDFSASDVGFTAPIRVEVAGALLGSDEQNFRMEGAVGPIGETPDAMRIPFLAEIEFDSLDADALRSDLPEVAAWIPPDLGLSGPLRLRARLEGSPSQVSVLDLDFAAAILAADEPNLVVKGAVGPVSAYELDSGLGIDLQFELEPVVIDEITKIEALVTAFSETLSAPEPVRLHGAVKGTRGQLDLSASLDGSDAAMSFGSAFIKPEGVPLVVDLKARRSGETLDVSDLNVRLATLALSAHGGIVTAGPILLDMYIDVSPTQLDGWDRLVPALAAHDVSGKVEARLHAVGEGRVPRLTGVVAFQDLEAELAGWPHRLEGFSSTVEFTGNGAVLPPTKFSVGGSPVELQANVDGFQTPVVRFTLHSPELRATSVGIASESDRMDEVARDLTMNGEISTGGAGPAFRGTVRSSGGRMRGVDFRDLEAEVRLAQEVATLDDVRLHALGGDATGSGHYDMRDVESPKFDVQSTIKGMQIRNLLASRFPDAAGQVEGSFHARLSLAGTGQDWETIRQTLRGGGEAELKDGALKEVNITEAVLGSVTGIPGLSSLIPQRVRVKYPELFDTSDTKFHRLGGSARIADGRVVTDDVVLTAKDYTIRGRGAFTLKNQVDFTATAIASKRLTDDVLVDVPIAKHLTGPQGCLEIPFQLTGELPRVRPQPDVDFLARAIEAALVEEGLGKLLDGMSGKKEKEERKQKKGLKKGQEKREKQQKQHRRAQEKQEKRQQLETKPTYPLGAVEDVPEGDLENNVGP